MLINAGAHLESLVALNGNIDEGEIALLGGAQASKYSHLSRTMR